MSLNPVSKKEERTVFQEIRKLGYNPHVMRGVARTVIGAIGDELTHPASKHWRRCFPRSSKVSCRSRSGTSSFAARPTRPIPPIPRPRTLIGGKKFHVMAGPCSVESEKQIMATAQAVKERRGDVPARRRVQAAHVALRVPGLGEKGLKLLAKARKETGLAVITELLSENHAELVAEYADILQIGARNAQNFQLLIAAAKTGKPVLLKRGLSMRIEEWLLAGEYVLANGNGNLMFCERGIRTFETYTRNTLDLSTIPIIKKESHCPIVIDPSQGAGRADLVKALCKGAVAMGADALLIEVHPNPAEAWSDGAQQLPRWLRGADAGIEAVHRGGGTNKPRYRDFIRRGERYETPILGASWNSVFRQPSNLKSFFPSAT